MMKFRTCTIMCFLLILSNFSFASGNKIKVGIFDPQAAGGKGGTCKKVFNSLEDSKQIERHYFSDLKLKNLLNYDVIIFSCVHSVGKQPALWKDNIKTFTEAGGGIIFTHDSCGYAHDLSPSFFSDILTAKGRDCGGKMVTKETHPLASGLEKSFVPGYSQYVVLQKGPIGQIIIEDEKGQPIVISGRYGMGKIIGIGFLAGYKSEQQTEIKFLRNCIKWLADKNENKMNMNDMQKEIFRLRRQVILMRTEIDRLQKKLEKSNRDLYNQLNYAIHGKK